MTSVEIEGYHRHPRTQGTLYSGKVLQVITIGPVPGFVPLLEHQEGSIGDDVLERPSCQIKLPDALLGEHRRQVVLPSQREVGRRWRAPA